MNAAHKVGSKFKRNLLKYIYTLAITSQLICLLGVTPVVASVSQNSQQSTQLSNFSLQKKVAELLIEVNNSLDRASNILFISYPDRVLGLTNRIPGGRDVNLAVNTATPKKSQVLAAETVNIPFSRPTTLPSFPRISLPSLPDSFHSPIDPEQFSNNIFFSSINTTLSGIYNRLTGNEASNQADTTVSDLNATVSNPLVDQLTNEVSDQLNNLTASLSARLNNLASQPLRVTTVTTGGTSSSSLTSLPQGITYTDLTGATIIDSFGNVFPSNAATVSTTKPSLGTYNNRYYGLYVNNFWVDTGGNLTANGKVTLGSGTNYVSFGAALATDIVPYANGADALGATGNYFGNAYITTINTSNITATNNISVTGTEAITGVETITGSQPSAASGSTGTDASTVLTVTGAQGGSTTTTGTGTGGTGSGINLTAGAGGIASSASVPTGGVGGSLTLLAGAGGAASSGTGGVGGSVSITGGNAGAGGNINGGSLSLDSGTITGTGTSTVNLGINNATVIHIGSTLAKVGLGTASPTNMLDVNGAVAIGTYAANNAAPANGLIVSGNVGIGTSSPGSLLTVNGALALGTGSSTLGTAIFNNATNSNTATLQAGTTSSSYTLTLPTALPGSTQCLQSTTGGAMSFVSCGGSSQWVTSGSDIYYNTGDVAIGTTTPTANVSLEVIPTITGVAGTTYYGFKSDATLNGSISSAITAYYANYNGPTIGVSGSNHTVTSVYEAYRTAVVNSGASVTTLYGDYIAAPTGSGSVGTKYALVTESGAGNVGIGTTSPGALLEINGATKIDGNITAVNTAVLSSVSLTNAPGTGTCASQSSTTTQAVIQTTTVPTSSMILVNTTRSSHHAQISAVTNCTDGSSLVYQIFTTTSTTGQTTGDTVSIYTPTATIGDPTTGFIKEFYGVTAQFIVNSTTGLDLAEQYPTTDLSIEPGDVVRIDKPLNDNGTQGIAKSSQVYDSASIGIVSTSPGYILGTEDGDRWKKVALAGRVPTKVSTINGEIHTGDYLTSSSIPGVAMKATQAGPTIGKALQDYLNSDPSAVGKIEVIVNVSYANPQSPTLTLNTDGTAIKTSTSSNNPSVAGNGLAVDSGNLSGPQIVNLIKNAASGVDLKLAKDTNFSVKDASGSAVATIDDQGNATFKGTITADKIKANQIEGLEVIADNVISNKVSQATAQTQQEIDSLKALLASSSAGLQIDKSEVAGIATASAQIASDSATASSAAALNLTPPDILLATGSATLANINVSDTVSSLKLNANDVTVSETFNSLGTTNLASTNIAGDLVVDGTLSIASISKVGDDPTTIGNSINALSTLYLQNSPIAEKLDIFSGKVTIDKDGVLAIQKLVVSNKTLSESVIPSGQTTVTILTDQITPTSNIFVTSETVTNKPLATVNVVPGKSFDVAISTPDSVNIKFKWWIVDSK